MTTASSATASRAPTQPGGKYAPLYFISGQLFTRDAFETLYSKLTIPVLVLYDKDNYVNFDRLPDFTAKPQVRAVRIVPSQGLPQFEQAGRKSKKP